MLQKEVVSSWVSLHIDQRYIWKYNWLQSEKSVNVELNTVEINVEKLI